MPGSEQTPSLTFNFLPGLEPVEALERSLDYLFDELLPAANPLSGYDLSDPALAESGLSKRVPDVHHSQTQVRSRGGQFARRHHAFTQAKDAGGRFRQRLTLAEREAAADQAAVLLNDQLAPRLQTHLADFTAQRLPGQEWYERCEKDLRLFYELIYREGKRSVGDPAIRLTPQDKAVINRVLKDELHYLKGFQTHLETGGGRMPYKQRMGLYAKAAREAFWMGWTLGDQRRTRMIRWMFGATENHCGIHDGGEALGCSDFEAMQWQSVDTFVKEVLSEGYMPQSGKLECQGHHCKCYLQEQVDETIQPSVVPSFGD